MATLIKQLTDGRWQFRTESGAYFHVTPDEVLDMVEDVYDELQEAADAVRKD